MPTQREMVTHLQNCGRQQIRALELATSDALAYKLLATHFGIGIYCYLFFCFCFFSFLFFLIYVKESALLLLLLPYTIRVKCTMPKQV